MYTTQPSNQLHGEEPFVSDGTCARFVKIRDEWHMSLAPGLAGRVQVGTTVTCDVETRAGKRHTPVRHRDPHPGNAGRHPQGALPHRGVPGRARQRRAQHVRDAAGRRLGRAAPRLGVAAVARRRHRRGGGDRQVGPRRARQGADHRHRRERTRRPPGDRGDRRARQTAAAGSRGSRRRTASRRPAPSAGPRRAIPGSPAAAPSPRSSTRASSATSRWPTRRAKTSTPTSSRSRWRRTGTTGPRGSTAASSSGPSPSPDCPRRSPQAAARSPSNQQNHETSHAETLPPDGTVAAGGAAGRPPALSGMPGRVPGRPGLPLVRLRRSRPRRGGAVRQRLASSPSSRGRRGPCPAPPTRAGNPPNHPACEPRRGYRRTRLPAGTT